MCLEHLVCMGCGVVRHHIRGASGTPYAPCEACGTGGERNYRWVSVPPNMDNLFNADCTGVDHRKVADARLDLVADEVEESWTANDGGLTAAATDVLSLVAKAKSLVADGDKLAAMKWAASPFDWSDGLAIEADIADIVREWAWDIDFRKLRRRIEDALRKTASKRELIEIAHSLNVKIY